MTNFGQLWIHKKPGPKEHSVPWGRIVAEEATMPPPLVAIKIYFKSGNLSIYHETAMI
jgi:hypothetical protein